uniref:Ubiquinone biosynthesis protein n=1 Tax=Panagrolaimus superbus TaxID=310955 RepID=A0A914XTR4_9BILA
MSTALTQAVKKPNIFRRAGRSLIEYTKHVANDYKTVVIETVQDIPKHPIRSTIFTSTLGAIIAAVCTNPTEFQMWNRIAEWRIEMGLVPNSIHNTAADSALIERTELKNTNRYDYWNCLLFSLVTRRTYDRKVQLFAAQDSNLKDWPWDRFLNNLVDIGAFNRFWLLEKQFVDYDIKKEEFPEEEKP